LTQIVATGPQDKWLTQDPEISLFETVYSRYEIFSIESIQQTISGTADFGRRVTVEVARSGDLLKDVILEITLPAVTVTGTNAGFRWAPGLAHTIVEKVEFQIGGLTIDTHYGDFYHAEMPLVLPASKTEGYNDMIGQQNKLEDATNPSNVNHYYNGLQTFKTSHASTKLYLPLRFYFTKNAGLSFPLSSILFNPVKFNIWFKALASCYETTGTGVTFSTGTPALAGFDMWIDYVFMPNDIRDRFVNECHTYLVTQLQFNGAETFTGSNAAVKLPFNHPTKELVVYCREAAAETANRWTTFDTYNASGPAGAAGLQPISAMRLQISGRDRFAAREGPYFDRVHPYVYHTAIPKQRGIFVIPLGMNLEDPCQPAGTLNLTRVENAQILATLTNASAANPVNVYVYAINVNFLKVQRGVAGLVYAT
jgi:hypothetical protein